MKRISALALGLLLVLGAAAPVSAPPPPPGWAAGLGMRDLETEIGARIDDGVAQHKLDAARAAAPKGRMTALEDQEQTYRAART